MPLWFHFRTLLNCKLRHVLFCLGRSIPSVPP